MLKPIAALLVALTGLVAQPDPTTTPTTPPDPLSVDVVGDSLTDQAYNYLGGWVDPPSPDTEKIAQPGWDMDDADSPYAASVAANPPDVTVLALGNNDADPASGGWDLWDIVRWSDFLNDLVPTGSCVVVVLPRFGATANLAWSREVNEARGYIVDLIAPGGQFTPPPGVTIVLEDWYLPITPRPDFLAADGIHLSGADADADAPAHARQDLMWDGAANCPQGGA